MQSYINSLTRIYQELESKHNFFCPVQLQIIISKRLRSANGSCFYGFDRFTKEMTEAKITMSYALLQEFGWEQFEKTFRHEVAHLANYILYKGKRHDYTFKILCRKFGGTMNSKHAGYAFRNCATKNFVKTIKTWQYSCPCGYSRQTAKRMSYKKRMYNTHVCGQCGKVFTSQWKEQRIA